MPLPNPKQPGDPFTFPAEMYNRLLSLIRDRGTQPPGGGPLPGSHDRPRLTVRLRNNTGTDVQRGEILPISGLLFGPDENLDAAYQGIATAESDDAPPRYSQWGVATEPIASGKVGLVAVGGIVLAKLAVEYGVWHWQTYVDVHPDPSDAPGSRDAWRLFPRKHGRARFLGHDRISEGDDEGLYYGWIDMGQSNWTIPIQAKTTVTSAPAEGKFDAYVGHDTSDATLGDTIEVEIDAPFSAAAFRALGLDDCIAAGYSDRGTMGWAQWDWTEEGGGFVLTDWPRTLFVEAQAEFDGYPFAGTGTVNVKLTPGPDRAGIGPAFDAQLGLPTGTHGDTSSSNQATAHGEASTKLQLVRLGDQLAVDVGYLLDAPYGTIRPYAGISIDDTHPGPHHGWYWCNGSNGTPDLRDRFLVGQSDDHPYETTGGHATHGDGVNDHDDHDLSSLTPAECALGWQQQNVLPTDASSLVLEHTETDNEPPWYAVAFAGRRPAV